MIEIEQEESTGVVTAAVNEEAATNEEEEAVVDQVLESTTTTRNGERLERVVTQKDKRGLLDGVNDQRSENVPIVGAIAVLHCHRQNQPRQMTLAQSLTKKEKEKSTDKTPTPRT